MKNEIKSKSAVPAGGKYQTEDGRLLHPLTDEQIAALNSHAALLAERDGLKDLLLHTQRTAIEIAEERDRLRACLTRTLAALPGCVSRGEHYTEAILADIRTALAVGGTTPPFPEHARPRLQTAVTTLRLKTAAALRVQDLEGRAL